MKKKNLTISACMMVKNEEEMLPRCLNSIKHIVDEIIIVDTGSTDSTIQIAKSFGAKIYHHPWEQDFSKHRNQSIGYATGDWFLIIDADEEMDSCHLKKEDLKNILRKAPKELHCFLIKLTDKDIKGQISATAKSARIFRNRVGVEYRGIVHNTAFYSGKVMDINLQIFHYGYALPEPQMQVKYRRTSTLLLKRVENDPDDYTAYYYLCQVYMEMKEYQQAIRYAQQCLDILPTEEESGVDISFYYSLYHNITSSYIEMAQYDMAENTARKGLTLLPDEIDLYYDISYIGHLSNNYELTIQGAKNYLRVLNDFRKNKLSHGTRFVFSTSNEIQLTVEYWLMDACIATQRFKDALKIWERNREVMSRKLSFEKELLASFETASMLHQRVDKNHDDYPAYFYLSQLYMKIKDEEQGIEYARKCLELLLEADKTETGKQPNRQTGEQLNKQTGKQVNKQTAESGTEISKKDSDINFYYSIYHVLALALISQKDYAKALDIVQEGLEKLPDEIDLLYDLACTGYFLDDPALIVQGGEPYLRLVDKSANKADNLEQTAKDNSSRLISTTDASTIFSVKCWLMTACMTLNRLDDYEKLWEELQYQLNAQTLSGECQNKTELYQTRKFMYDTLECHILTSRKADEYEFLASAIKKYQELQTDYEKTPLTVLVIIAEFLLKQNDGRKFLEISSLLLKTYIKQQLDGVKGAAQLASAYNILAQQQDKTKNGILTAISCLNIAWILTDEQCYLEAIENLKENIYLIHSDKIVAVKQSEISIQQSGIENSTLQHTLSDQSSLMAEKTRIIFFVKQGMDSFIGDIINELSGEYETKKVIVTDYNQIDREIKSADICWFEWCDELIIHASKLDTLKDKKVICRLHSYEAFVDYPTKVNWNNVDKTIFVAEHIRNIVLEKASSLSREKSVVIPNGIDLEKYHFKNRKPGFKIAYVGYINYKKGPMLLLHTFKAIYDSDSRYKLYIAGTFQDNRDILYYRQMIDEMELGNSVIHEGWQNDVDKWLEDKNYIICTSLLESQNMSIMQAMAKGIKPLVHNFVGAKGIYSEQYLWNTIPECIKMLINNSYNSIEYRNFIENRYSFTKEVSVLKNTLENLIHCENSKTNEGNEINPVINETEKAPNTFDYAAYWNNRLNKKFDIEGVGYIGLGKVYNKYLYMIRFDILNYILQNLFQKGLKKKRVLELGPGIGMFTDYFHKQKAVYEGIDISEKSVRELKIFYKDYKFIQGDISNSALFKSNGYDLVFAADVLLHITDEDRYKIAVSNISKALKKNGYAILFDPITVINTKSQSPHVVIRDIEYIKKMCADNGLEVVEMLPCAFFMNFPFDKELIDGRDDVAIIFSLIQKFFGNEAIDDKDKEVVAQWLSTFEKLCLMNYNFGLSQKVIVVKKIANNHIFALSINNVWNKKKIWKENAIATENYSALMQNGHIPDLNNIIDLDRLINKLMSAADNEDKVLTVDYLKKNNEEFIPFNSLYADLYDFEGGYKILIGKKEKITSKLELVEFIIENSGKRKLLFLNIWHDLEAKRVVLPAYLSESNKNSYFITEAIKTVTDLNVNYVNNIGGFINDKDIQKDVEKNRVIYNWERGIPATQFVPARGFLIIIERYKFAAREIKSGDTILEAASGFGYGAAYLSQFCNHVYALDIAQDNIDFAQSCYQLPNIIWQNGDVTRLPYKDSYFDAYISFETMEHLALDVVELYFNEAVRVIKKGGKMVISTPNREMRTHVNNPFHIKEYSFLEFDLILRRYFSEINYFSVVNYKVLNGFKDNAFDMIAVCTK